MTLRFKELGFTNYKDYQSSSHWKQLRAKIKPKRCYACGKQKRLQLHHMTYERLGKELNADLCFLCDRCHKAVHHAYMDLFAKKPWNVNLLTYATNWYRLTFLKERKANRVRPEPKPRKKKQKPGQGVRKALKCGGYGGGYAVLEVPRPRH